MAEFLRTDTSRRARAQANYRRSVDLRDARLPDSQHRAHFPHGELVEMIERQHFALPG